MQPRTRYPVRERFRDCLSKYVIRRVDICVDDHTGSRSKQAPLDTFARVLRVPRDRLAVQETAPACIPLVHHDRGDAHERIFVLDLPDEGLEGQPHEILVGCSPQAAPLLPAGVVPDGDNADVVPDAEVHHGAGCLVEDIAQLVCPGPMEALDPSRG